MSIFSWLQTWSGVISGFGSLALSAALVWLYFRQKQILEDQVNVMEEQSELQRQQSDIMGNQESLMELNYRPELRIEGFEIWENDGVDKHSINKDVMIIELSNIGNGLASNLHLRLDLLLFDEDSVVDQEERQYTIEGRDREITLKPNFSWLTEIERGRDLYTYPTGGMLKEEESGIYTGYIMVGREEDSTGNSRGTSFTHLMDLLSEASISKVGFQLTLVYTDMSDKVYSSEILTGQAEVERGKSFKEASQEQPGGVGIGGLHQSIEEQVPNHW